MSLKTIALITLLLATLSSNVASAFEQSDAADARLRKLRRWNCALVVANAVLIPVAIGVIGAAISANIRSKAAWEKNRLGDPHPLLGLNFLSNWPEFDEWGNPHIGRGYYLDIDGIEASLSYEEHALLANPAENWPRITTMFALRLTGKAMDVDDSKPRKASSIFIGSGQPGGVCRDRATVLTGILNHYKIRARIRSGWLNKTDTNDAPNHVWTELIDYDHVSDPTNLILLKEKDRYIRRHLSFYGDGVRIIKVEPRD